MLGAVRNRVNQSQNINSHPQGHWSINGTFNDDSNGDLDVIQAYSGTKPKERLKHKDMFNKAFDQSRDYTFYGTGQSIDSDTGTFCSQGIWKTF
jgi:hypothetical protein